MKASPRSTDGQSHSGHPPGPGMLLIAHAPVARKIVIRTCLLAGLLWLAPSCATKPGTHDGDRPAGGRYTMAGYEFSTRGGEDTRPRILERFGPPLAEERAGSPPDYRILSYPVVGESDRLLLLFHEDHLLGVFRESARAALDGTLHSHQRAQGGRVVVFQSQFETERTVYFTATREQLNRVPRWKPGDQAAPPLTEGQAEAIVTEWQKTNASEQAGGARVLRLLEVRSVPGVCFYQVALGGFRSPPQPRHVLVLMDGTLIVGDVAP